MDDWEELVIAKAEIRDLKKVIIAILDDAICWAGYVPGWYWLKNPDEAKVLENMRALLKQLASAEESEEKCLNE